MFNPNDLYTTLGSNKLQPCWTSLVTKFDTSSFYNWEQDNLPLHDLDERTAYLWQRFGYPTSSINGVGLVVSADVTESCNSTNVFKTLSGCLNAIPEVINYPIIVEVASFGNLGTLQLSNKVFGPRGSIEIINRNFSKPVGWATVTGEVFGANAEVSATEPYWLASSLISTYVENLLRTPATTEEFKFASSIILSSYVFSANPDSRLTNNLTVFCRKFDFTKNQRMTAALAAKNTTTPWSVAQPNLLASRVDFLPYELNPDSWESIDTYDASTINEINNSEIIFREGDGTIGSNSLSYGNRLNSIKIYNCNGPIYIRGFTVDGGGSFSGIEYGIDIRNSTVTIEDCSVARCKKAGLHSLNSKTNITRSFVAYRNYSFNKNNTRNDLPWLDKINNKYYNTSSNSDMGAGILAINSEINFSATDERDYYLLSASLENNYKENGTSAWLLLAFLANSYPAPANWMLCLSRNQIGLHAINSVIKGGKNEINRLSTQPGAYETHNLIFELNSDSAIKLDNSRFEHSGKIFLYSNFRGIEADSSKISLDVLNAKYNQKEACLLRNSSLNYNKDLYIPYLNVAYNQNFFGMNGTHLKLINSTYEPTYASAMPSLYERFVASGSFGVTQGTSDQRGILPSIIVDSGSKLKLVSPAVELPQSLCDDEKPMYGGGFYVNDNSELLLQGTSAYVTKIIGPSDFNYQNNKTGIYGNNGSVVKIQGPTVIAKYGVDVLVDNNSKLEITPHKKEDGTLDVNGFSLSTPGNHTSVELHSTRACLVANNNSVITMKDVGSYLPFWSIGAYGSSVLLSGLDYPISGSLLNYPIYTSGGSIQFYPNPNDSLAFTGTGTSSVPNQNLALTGIEGITRNAFGYNYYLNQYLGDKANNQSFSSTTLGGMCVRALNGSKVNVDNVHFPCGWPNPSGIVYEYDGPEGICSRLFIWNIADLSQLNARYVTVSGIHPADAAYFGPSGTWGSASGAPTGTPDTGSVSILDLYGRATNHSFGNSSATNQGPFRLYFSVDPAINWATPIGVTGLNGFLPQVYAQGYQFSGNLTFSGNLGSIYKGISQGNTASGFYYASSIMSSPKTMRVLLDDSAANAFANAKHNSTGKSGLADVVDFYYPFKDQYGGDSASDSVKNRGKGVKSVNTFDLEKLN